MFEEIFINTATQLLIFIIRASVGFKPAINKDIKKNNIVPVVNLLDLPARGPVVLQPFPDGVH
jgi:hypothetical protein